MRITPLRQVYSTIFIGYDLACKTTSTQCFHERIGADAAGNFRLVPPPPFGGSFRGETGCCVWHVGGGEASAVMPRQALEPVCPRVSLGPSRRSFIGEARASVRRALPQVRVHVTAPSRAEAVASKEV